MKELYNPSKPAERRATPLQVTSHHSRDSQQQGSLGGGEGSGRRSQSTASLPAPPPRREGIRRQFSANNPRTPNVFGHNDSLRFAGQRVFNPGEFKKPSLQTVQEHEKSQKGSQHSHASSSRAPTQLTLSLATPEFSLTTPSKSTPTRTLSTSSSVSTHLHYNYPPRKSTSDDEPGPPKAPPLPSARALRSVQAMSRMYDRTGMREQEKQQKQDLEAHFMEQYYKDAFAEDRKTDATRRALQQQKYHLPGNTWWQDWLAFFGNYHPILGLGCHHKLHPVNTGKRVLILIGSMAFGLCLTNAVYLWFLFYSDPGGMDAPIVVINITTILDGSAKDMVQDFKDFHHAVASSGISYLMILFFIGGPIHGLFDHLIWWIDLAPCFQPGGCWASSSWFSSFLSVFVALLLLTSVTLAIVLHVMSQNVAINSIWDTEGFLKASHRETLTDLSTAKFDFLLWWYGELMLEYFVFNFVVGTIFFSGALSCGSFLCGRRKEMKEEREAMEKEEEKFEQEMMYRRFEQKKAQSSRKGLMDLT